MRFINNGVMLETVDWKEGDGRWDCIYRSAYAAMAYGNYELLKNAAYLCIYGQRWPKKIGKPSKRMTRDPYIMTICALFLANQGAIKTGIEIVDKDVRVADWLIQLMEDGSMVKSVKIPFFSGGRMLYRPHLWAWRKFLITGEEKYKKRYEFWARLGMRLIKYPVYGLVLEAFMAYTADFGITEVKMEIRKQVVKRRLEWNLLLMILTAGDAFLCREHWVPFAKAYQPKERNQWTEETWRTDGYYTGDYKIDLDILTYLLER